MPELYSGFVHAEEHPRSTSPIARAIHAASLVGWSFVNPFMVITQAGDDLMLHKGTPAELFGLYVDAWRLKSVHALQRKLRLRYREAVGLEELLEYGISLEPYQRAFGP